MNGVKHLIECQCILPIFKDKNPPVFHKFTVFSKIDDDDNVEQKFVRCPNCHAIHKILGILKSEICPNEEKYPITSIDDIKTFLPSAISSVLETYNCDIASWEEAKFILDNQSWGKFIVVSREETDGITTGKLLMFVGPNHISVESFVRDELI